MPIRTLILVALVAAALAGCGRRGALETPGEPETTLAPGGGSAAYTLDAASPGAQEREREQPPAPQRRFFLDFLL
jgi:predicted small lipoprotein YifL